MLRTCLGVDGTPCGELTASRRCPTHAKEWERRRPSRRVLGRYDTRWVKLVEIAKRRQPWCSGYQRPPHASDDLTGDHIVPLLWGGKNELSNIDVLCRSCNAAKRDRMLAPT
jgi:5-methylcytosine-specific restriction endonuclease McrA